MKRIFFIILMCLMCLQIVGCTSRRQINEMFDTFETETDDDVAYVLYDTLVVDKVSLDFKELLDSNDINGTFHEVYFVQDNIVWFGYSEYKMDETKGTTWNVATVSLDGTGFCNVYSGLFGFDDKAIKTYKCKQNMHLENDYLIDNGYYYEGKIVLTDYFKTVEIDLSTTLHREFLGKEYKHPLLPIKVDITDCYGISFSKIEENQTFDVQRGRETSQVFERLCTLEQKKTWQNKSYLSELFDQVQICNNIIYIVCRVINWDGETHAVIFQYDYEKNTCQYAFHCYVGDVIGNDLTIVPIIGE